MNQQRYLVNGKPIDIYFKVDRFIHEVLERKEYGFLFHDLVVLDVGCNIGTWTFSIYDHIKQAYALDVSQECIDIMNQTIAKNQLTKVKTFCLGLAAESGKRNVQVDDEPGLGGWHFTTSDHPSIGVDVIDIKSLMDNEKIEYIDVMKIDVEGAEHEIFESQAFRDVAHRINTIVGEFHSRDPGEVLTKAGFYYQPLWSHFIAKRNK